MKTITLTFLSVLILLLNSCSSDDPLTDDNGGNSKPQRRITKIETISTYRNTTETFSYDKQGRWIEHIEKWNNDYNNSMRVYTLTYSENVITYSGKYIENEYQADYDIDTFELKNNIIISRNNKTPYHYSNGYWVQIGESYGDFEYTNGNLTKVIEGKGESGEKTYIITYTDYPDKMGFCPYETSYNDTAIGVNPANILYQFGYFGKKSKNLIKSINNSTSYSYKFDNEGYVTEIVEKETYQGTTDITTYKIYYE